MERFDWLTAMVTKGMVFLNHFCPRTNNLESETAPWNRPRMMANWVIFYRLVKEIPVYRSVTSHNMPRKSVRYLGVSAAMLDKGEECTGIFHTASRVQPGGPSPPSQPAERPMGMKDITHLSDVGKIILNRPGP